MWTVYRELLNIKSILIELVYVDVDLEKEIISLLKEKGDLTTSIIAENLDEPLKIIRKVLYALEDKEKVSYKRVTDMSTGRFTYYWKCRK